jgi:hypothetical protein
MRSFRLSVCALFIYGACSVGWTQYHRPTQPRYWGQPPEQPSVTQAQDLSSSPPAKADADELLKLAQSVSLDVEAVRTKGLMSKDLKGKLKRIESLSKKLRNELQL